MFEMMSNLHFLRPWWFLALLPIAWFIWRIWQVNQKQGAWHQVIDVKFRKLLLGDNISNEPTLNEKLGYLGLGLVWFFTVLALSGPWVRSVDVPAQKSQQGVVIVLDLSLSMLADDITPNRLARVKYTLTDLLKQNPDYAVGMVVYSGSAHTISPISEDNKTLLNLLPSLNPVVMPKFGSEPLLGMQKADDLLNGAKITQGHIIWITDDIEGYQMDGITSWINSKPYTMSLLTVGSEKGGVVQIPNYGLLKEDNGDLILPSLPLKRFADLADEADMKWNNLQIGQDNTKGLLPPKLTADQNQSSQIDDGINHPLDIGIYFLFILIPMVAYLFRRGTLLSLAMFALIPIGLLNPQPVYASSLWSDLGDVFKSHDQQGYDAWEQQDYAKAEALFENRQWRASALYREGRYAEAARLFAEDKSAKGYFNQANALAHDMQLDKAIDAYQQALLINPNMQQAKDNLNLVQQLKMNSQKQSSLDQLDPDLPKTNADNKPSDQENEAQQDKQQNLQSETAKKNQNGADDQAANQQNNSGAAQQGLKADGSTDQAQAAQQGNPTDGIGQNAQEIQSSGNATNATQNPTANSQQGSNGLAESTDSNGEQTQGTNQQGMQAGRLADGSKNGTEKKPASPVSEEELAQQNWLKQIPDQPGVFLKRKFEYQYQQDPSVNDENKKQW